MQGRPLRGLSLREGNCHQTSLFPAMQRQVPLLPLLPHRAPAHRVPTQDWGPGLCLQTPRHPGARTGRALPGVRLSWSHRRAGGAITSHLLCPSAPRWGVACRGRSQKMPLTWTDRPQTTEIPNLLCCIPSPFPSVPLPRDMGTDHSLLRPPSSSAGWVWPTGTPFPWASLCS